MSPPLLARVSARRPRHPPRTRSLARARVSGGRERVAEGRRAPHPLARAARRRNPKTTSLPPGAPVKAKAKAKKPAAKASAKGKAPAGKRGADAAPATVRLEVDVTALGAKLAPAPLSLAPSATVASALDAVKRAVKAAVPAGASLALRTAAPGGGEGPAKALAPGDTLASAGLTVGPVIYLLKLGGVTPAAALVPLSRKAPAAAGGRARATPTSPAFDRPRTDTGARKRKRWTATETEALARAVRACGFGKWAAASTAAGAALATRSQVDCKDRWRSLQKQLARGGDAALAELSAEARRAVRDSTAAPPVAKGRRGARGA